MVDKQVKAVVSYSQEIDGKKYKPGSTVSLDADLARVLVGRGSIKIQEQEAVKSASAPAMKEVSK